MLWFGWSVSHTHYVALWLTSGPPTHLEVGPLYTCVLVCWVVEYSVWRTRDGSLLFFPPLANSVGTLNCTQLRVRNCTQLRVPTWRESTITCAPR